MRFAYADPPYLGTSSFGAAHHYGEHHDDAADANDPEWHRALVARLVDEFPDGWALSLSSPSLRVILPMCPPDCRVSAWVKPFASFKPGVNPAYCWEPVIWRGGRSAKERGGRKALTVKDFVSCNITLKKGLSGAKPEGFCRWLFDLLGLRPEDEFVDLFPGTGVVTTTWREWAKEKQAPHGRCPRCDGPLDERGYHASEWANCDLDVLCGCGDLVASNEMVPCGTGLECPNCHAACSPPEANAGGK